MGKDELHAVEGLHEGLGVDAEVHPGIEDGSGVRRIEMMRLRREGRMRMRVSLRREGRGRGGRRRRRRRGHLEKTLDGIEVLLRRGEARRMLWGSLSLGGG